MCARAGWGVWGGEGVKPAKKQTQQMKPSKQRQPRKDDGLDHVIISEHENRKIRKHLVSPITAHSSQYMYIATHVSLVLLVPPLSSLLPPPPTPPPAASSLTTPHTPLTLVLITQVNICTCTLLHTCPLCSLSPLSPPSSLLPPLLLPLPLPSPPLTHH